MGMPIMSLPLNKGATRDWVLRYTALPPEASSLLITQLTGVEGMAEDKPASLMKEDATMSAGTMENIASTLKVQPKAGGFLKYRGVLIFVSQMVLVALTYYASFLLRLDAELNAASG